MRINLKRLLVAACVIGFCVTGVLLFHRPPDPMEIVSDEAPQTIQQTDLEPVTPATEPLRPRPQPILSRSPAATMIVPPEPPEDPDEAREWARKNPHDALVWMLNAPAGEKRDTVVEMACAQVAESDPA